MLKNTWMDWSRVKPDCSNHAYSGMSEFKLNITHSLSKVNPTEWDALIQDNNPFLKHAFLLALENHDCLRAAGWHPQHFLLRDHTGQLQGAAPAYIKGNSFGEFVFDAAWASAYERVGQRYYPKLVLAIPFTPATGQRLLLNTNSSIAQSEIMNDLTDAILHTAQEQCLSGIHCLFPVTDQTEYFRARSWLVRFDYQYHWNNQGYRDFEDFLSFFRSHKRKNIKRERARVVQQNITFAIKHGDELSDSEWQAVFNFYQSTFYKKGNYPALSQPFFRSLGATLGKQFMVVFALQNQQIIAGAIFLRSDSTLYGRYWGSYAEYDSLHFETCFYQGIEYCIQHGLRRFEPGAQGEHKILRGFLPTATWSCHWIYDNDFRNAIGHFLNREKTLMQDYKQHLDALSPFREDQPA